MIRLATLKKGEFFKRTENAKTVFVKGHYNRSSKKYSCLDTEDMNREIFLSGNKQVYIDFEY